MHRFRPLVACLLFTVLGPSAAPAQTVTAFGQQIGLVSQPRVKQELRLDDGQSEKAAKAFEAFETRTREVSKRARELDPEQVRQALDKGYREAVAEYKKELASFLQPQQFTRLRQINFQRLQGESFSDPDLLEELGLTADQRTKVEESHRRRMEKARQVSRLIVGDRKNRAAVLAAAKAVDFEHTEAVLEILTESQRERWKEMQGPRFDPE